MILKNKTNGTQTIVLKDGSRVGVRPYRTTTLDEKLIGNYSKEVFEVIQAEQKAKVVESTTKGK
jgi:hypothetical protein